MFDVILMAIADSQTTTLHKFVWFLHYGINGLDQIYQELDSRMCQTRKLELNAGKMVAYPDDMVGWLRLAFKQGDRLIGFGKDSSIYREDGDKPYVPREASWRLNNYYDERVNTGELDLRVFLKGHNSIGYFNDNMAKRRFEFSVDTFAQYVYLEYIGSAYTPNTETMVPAAAVDLLKAYILYKDVIARMGAKDNETLQRERLWKEERNVFLAKISDLSVEGILQGMTINTGMSNRF